MTLVYIAGTAVALISAAWWWWRVASFMSNVEEYLHEIRQRLDKRD